MNTQRWRLRLAAVLALTLGLLALAVHWSHRESGFATPTDCLDAYYEACQAGDAARCCLAEPLRLETRREFGDRERLAALLRQKVVKNWVVVAEPEGEKTASSVLVDEVRADNIKRIRFHLGLDGNSWIIVAVEPLQESQPPIRYGTDVRNVPDEAPTPGELPGKEETPDP